MYQEGEIRQTRTSANTANLLPSDLTTYPSRSPCFVKSCPGSKLLSLTRAIFEGQCQRHTVDGERTVDASKGTISDVMFRNAYHSTLPLFSFGEREKTSLNCCHALCDVHSTDSSPKPSPANRGRKASMTIAASTTNTTS